MHLKFGFVLFKPSVQTDRGAMRAGFSLQLTSILFYEEARTLLDWHVLETGDRVGN